QTDGSLIHEADIPAHARNQLEIPDATSVPAHTASGEKELLWTDGDDASPDPLMEIIAAVDDMMPATRVGIGANSWAVSGEHPKSGKPLLANAPHSGASLPSVWNQMTLRCAEVNADCPFDVSGFGFSGLPGIAIGHNQ